MTNAMQREIETADGRIEIVEYKECPAELKGILMTCADTAIEQIKKWACKADFTKYAKHLGWTVKEAEDIMRATFYTFCHVDYDGLSVEKDSMRHTKDNKEVWHAVNPEILFAQDIVSALYYSDKFDSLLAAATAYGIEKECTSEARHGMFDENKALDKLRKRRNVIEVFTYYAEPEAKEPFASPVVVVRNTRPQVKKLAHDKWIIEN